MKPTRKGRWSPESAVVMVLVLMTTALISQTAASAQTDEGAAGDRAPKVLIVSAPRLNWETVREEQPPRLMEFFSSAAVAMGTPRTVGPTTTPGEAYLTLGAGNRASSNEPGDGRVVELDEVTPQGDPLAEYKRDTGFDPTGSIVSLDVPSIEDRNDRLLYNAEPGALAGALGDAGKQMAVIANADETLGAPTRRHAGLAAIDRNGQVDAGSVNQRLLTEDPAASFGLNLNKSVVVEQFEKAWESSAVTLVELSDLERAERGRVDATKQQGDALFARALQRSDQLFAELMQRVDLEVDMVIVTSPTPPGEANEMTVFAWSRPGDEPGYASSSTTRRDGYVSLTDIAPSILDFLDVEIPDAMGNTRLTTTKDSDSIDNRVDWMVTESNTALRRDNAFGLITVSFIGGLLLMLCLAMLALARFAKLAPYVRFLALALLGVLPGSYLLGLVSTADASPGTLGLMFVAAGVALAIVASSLRRFGTLVPAVSIVALLWVVLAVDLFFGGELQINTIFGYSPIVAGRFAGFGNQAYSIFAISALLLASWFVEQRTIGSNAASRSTLLIVAVFFGLTIIVDGHPALGSDVGGVLSFAPAAAIALMLFAQRKVRLANVALIGAATVLVLALFAAVDLQRSAESQTHLGRFATELLDGGAGEILRRKLSANLRLLTAVWSWIIPAAMIYIGYLTWRPTRTLQAIQVRHPQFRTFGASGLLLGVVAMAVNDSGVSMPAIMLAISVCYVTYMVMGMESAFVRPASPPSASEDSTVEASAPQVTT